MNSHWLKVHRKNTQHSVPLVPDTSRGSHLLLGNTGEKQDMATSLDMRPEGHLPGDKACMPLASWVVCWLVLRQLDTQTRVI